MAEHSRVLLFTPKEMLILFRFLPIQTFKNVAFEYVSLQKANLTDDDIRQIFKSFYEKGFINEKLEIQDVSFWRILHTLKMLGISKHYYMFERRMYTHEFDEKRKEHMFCGLFEVEDEEQLMFRIEWLDLKAMSALEMMSVTEKVLSMGGKFYTTSAHPHRVSFLDKKMDPQITIEAKERYTKQNEDFVRTLQYVHGYRSEKDWLIVEEHTDFVRNDRVKKEKFPIYYVQKIVDVFLMEEGEKDGKSNNKFE